MDLHVCLGHGSNVGCREECGKGWVEQRNVTENSRPWGSMWSQDEFRRSGLKVREEIYDE